MGIILIDKIVEIAVHIQNHLHEYHVQGSQYMSEDIYSLISRTFDFTLDMHDPNNEIGDLVLYYSFERLHDDDFIFYFILELKELCNKYGLKEKKDKE